MNGDGIADLLVGNGASLSDQGAAYLFLGRSTANWQASLNKQVFSADFSNAGAPSLDNFTIDNTGITTPGLWHLSTRHNAQAGHSSGGGMYFGTGETASGGGNYDGPNRAGRITSPSITLAGLSTAELNFNYLLQTEPYSTATPSQYDVAHAADFEGRRAVRPAAGAGWRIAAQRRGGQPRFGEWWKGRAAGPAGRSDDRLDERNV